MGITELYDEGIDRLEWYIAAADAELREDIRESHSDDPTLGLTNGFSFMDRQFGISNLRRGLSSLKEPLIRPGTPLGDTLAGLADEDRYAVDRLRLPFVTPHVLAIALGRMPESRGAERRAEMANAADRAKAALSAALESESEEYRTAAMLELEWA